jgi:hypothetical protein
LHLPGHKSTLNNFKKIVEIFSAGPIYILEIGVYSHIPMDIIKDIDDKNGW